MASRRLRAFLLSFITSQDFKRNLRARSYVCDLLDERNLDNTLWQMPFRIRTIASFEDRKNPKAWPPLHQARRDEDVLVVVEINLVLPRDSLRGGHGEVGHVTIDFYVDRARVKRQPT